jgi:nitrite reductase/ring-hydroxylating ferredoxin subunit
MAGALRDLDGAPLIKQIAGEPVLFLRLDARIYAYRPTCPHCGESLAGAVLDGAHLRCAACGVSYDARRAGRSADVAGLHLEPVPLLVDRDGLVRVALHAAA